MKIRIGFTVVAIAASVSTAFGQSPATPPVLPAAPLQVKRVPAKQSSPQAQHQPPPLLQKYDFGSQLGVLEDPTEMDSQNFAEPNSRPRSAGCNQSYRGRSSKGLSTSSRCSIEPNSPRSRARQRDVACRAKHASFRERRTRVVRVRSGAAGCRLRSFAGLHDRIAAGRKDYW